MCVHAFTRPRSVCAFYAMDQGCTDTVNRRSELEMIGWVILREEHGGMRDAFSGLAASVCTHENTVQLRIRSRIFGSHDIMKTTAAALSR